MRDELDKLALEARQPLDEFEAHGAASATLRLVQNNLLDTTN